MNDKQSTAIMPRLEVCARSAAQPDHLGEVPLLCRWFAALIADEVQAVVGSNP